VELREVGAKLVYKAKC